MSGCWVVAAGLALWALALVSLVWWEHRDPTGNHLDRRDEDS